MHRYVLLQTIGWSCSMAIRSSFDWDCTPPPNMRWPENRWSISTVRTPSIRFSSRAWHERSVLFIAWDEGDGGDANLVPLIAATSRGLSGQVATPYDHYSLLATIEDVFHLPRLGEAKTAHPIAEVLAALE